MPSSRELKVAAVIDEFAKAISACDSDALKQVLPKFERFISPSEWQQAFRMVLSVEAVDEKIKRACLNIWVFYGDRLRSEIGNDFLLTDALRVLLPMYSGPSLQLYRGEQVENHKRRTYGLSWTSDRNIADHFAEFYDCRMSAGGSVLLTVDAPPDAIICSLEQCGVQSGEAEFLIDRRKLRGARVLKRFSELSPEQHDLLLKPEA